MTVNNGHDDESEFVLNGFADEDSFTDFYRRTSAALHGYICKATQDPSSAQDVMQVAYLRLLKAPPMDDSHRRAYLYRAASSVIVDRWRKMERERVHLHHQPQESYVGDPESTMDLNHLLEILNERERSLLWLAYAEGFDHHEIAGIMRISEKSVRVMLFRAREKAKSFFRARGEEKQ
jgi:RNA polymerase sigma-70 factor (ECF subfamily)